MRPEGPRSILPVRLADASVRTAVRPMKSLNSQFHARTMRNEMPSYC